MKLIVVTEMASFPTHLSVICRHRRDFSQQTGQQLLSDDSGINDHRIHERRKISTANRLKRVIRWQTSSSSSSASSSSSSSSSDMATSSANSSDCDTTSVSSSECSVRSSSRSTTSSSDSDYASHAGDYIILGMMIVGWNYSIGSHQQITYVAAFVLFSEIT